VQCSAVQCSAVQCRLVCTHLQVLNLVERMGQEEGAHREESKSRCALQSLPMCIIYLQSPGLHNCTRAPLLGRHPKWRLSEMAAA
jgi:hypothetical protein